MYNKVFRFVRGKLKNHRFNSIISEVYFQKVRQLCLSDSKYQDQEKILLKCKSNKALFISVDTGELYSARLGMMRAIKFLTQIYVLFGYVANSRLQTPCKKKHAWFSRSQNRLHLIKNVLHYFSYFISLLGMQNIAREFEKAQLGDTIENLK